LIDEGTAGSPASSRNSMVRVPLLASLIVATVINGDYARVICRSRVQVCPLALVPCALTLRFCVLLVVLLFLSLFLFLVLLVSVLSLSTQNSFQAELASVPPNTARKVMVWPERCG